MAENDAIYPSLAGRRVFITGGASGIGSAMVAHFAAQGAHVAFVDIAEDQGHALVEQVAGQGHPRPFFAPCDLRDIDSLRSAIAISRAAVGPFGVLVNNAAHDQRHAWQEVTEAYWDERIAVNLRHQFFAIQAIAPDMIAAATGSIINLGSISWHNAQGGMPAYTSSKAAIEGLTRSFARDLGRHNIRVNCLIPGWVMTERQLALWVTADSEAEIRRNQCLPSQLMPADLARMALWLAADDSRMCSAQNFVVDGGWV
jgi:NAD(P)-dependent dehydrogenase (short-subunit alcohol dehydrogenase family)